jgi:hypothetical protein
MTALRSATAHAETVRRLAADARAAQLALEVAIVDMRAEGAPLAEIAEASGYSAPGILKLLRRR